MVGDNIEKLVPILTKGWRRPSGLLTALLVAITPCAIIISATKPDFSVAVFIFLIPSLAILVGWLWARRVPKTKNGKVGFAISLWCSDEEAACKVREDFVLSLQRLIKSGRTGRSFQFIEIPAFIAENIIDHDDAQELRLKTKAHFIIYGRVRTRQVDGSDRYFLELDGIVAHKPIADDVSQRLAIEFSELLPRKVLLARENDLLSFQFTSEWAEIVAKYIIGIASAVSGDIQYAEDLYSDVRAKIQQIETDFPVFVNLRKRIPQRFAELHEAKARHAYEMWVSTHDKTHIMKLGEFLKIYNAENEAHKTPAMLTYSAIHYFLSTRNVENSVKCLNQIPKQARDAIWHFNHAFLAAYQGDLKQSNRYYRNGMNYQITPDLIAKIEDFLCSILAEEPDKAQLHFCLGLLNWKIKGDNLQATKDFNEFLAAGAAKDFHKEIKLVAKWLKKIEAIEAS